MKDTSANALAMQHKPLSAPLRALYEDPKIAPRIARFRQAHDPLDCLEELAMARALLEQFLESYEQQNAWAEAWQQAIVQETQRPPPPIRWLSLDDGLKFVKVIGDLAKVIQGMRLGDSMSKAEVKFKIFQLARVVEEEVLAQQVEDGWRESVLKKIKDKWLSIWI